MPSTTRRAFLAASAALGASPWLGGRAWGGSAAVAPLKLLILGGTAFLGPEFVEAATKRGHVVTLFNRGKTNPQLFPDLEKLRGDRNGDLKSLEGRQWDAVVDTSGYVPRQVRDSARLLAPNVGHYVFVSTCSVYKDVSAPGTDETAPVLTIDDPTVENIDENTYGPLKALCERAAEEAMPGRVANVRPGLIVGPGDPSDRFTYWPVRVSKGGEVLAPESPGEKAQWIDARDLGEWLVKLCEQKTTGVFNALGPATPLTMGETLDACKRVSGSDATFVWAEGAFLIKNKVMPWSDMPAWVPNTGESAGMSMMSNAKAIAAGLAFRTIDDTAKATLEWFKTLPPERRAKLKAGLTAEREREVLAAWKARDKAKD